MARTFMYTVVMLVRKGAVMFWALAFPIVLATMFSFMFAGMDFDKLGRDIGVVVVADAAWQDDGNAPVREVVDGFAQPGTASDQTGALLRVTSVPDMAAAREALEDTDAVAILSVPQPGAQPVLSMRYSAADSSEMTTRQTIDKTALESSVRIEKVARDAIGAMPANGAVATPSVPRAGAADAAAAATMSPAADIVATTIEDAATASYTQRVSITRNAPSDDVRYYYALFGMAMLMAGSVGLSALTGLLPNMSAQGARRSVSAAPRKRQVAATLMAAWLVSCLCLVAAYAYIRIVLGVDMGDKDGLACVAIVVASLMSTSLGALFGALPRLSVGAKSGILTGVSCLASLFAGLYGTVSMQLADTVAANAPLAALLNPARQISQAFYSLYYYDTYGPYALSLLVLIITAAVLFAGTVVLTGRHKHAHL